MPHYTFKICSFFCRIRYSYLSRFTLDTDDVSFFCLKERKKRGGIETKYQVFSHPAEYEKISLLA